MSSDQTETFTRDGLVITVTRAADGATMEWHGTSDSREPEIVLSPFLRRLVAASKGKPMTIDFRRFEYMNSATVSPILQFIKSLDAAEVPTTLIYDTALEWQRINYQCMKTVARALKRVQVRGNNDPLR